MDDLIAAGAPWPCAIAVSGGGDSVALMHLLAGWAKRRRRRPPPVLTVDHGLRTGSDRESRDVVRWARKSGLEGHVLRWSGPKPGGDLEAAARDARYRLIGAWLNRQGLRGVCVGHTRDDQAETFLLRLARGSGLDGLAAMRPLSAFPLEDFSDLVLLRPLLSLERGAVRDHLQRLDKRWFDDPMNSDARFGRARLRTHWGVLEGLGLTSARVADAAAHLSRAREALDAVTVAVLARACRLDGKTALVDRAALTSAPREVGLRALARLLMTVSGHRYRPRFERLERVFDWLGHGNMAQGCTLHGCHIGRAPRAQAIFGAETVLIAPETPRRRGEKATRRSRNRHSGAVS
jgi:tRNA(Ile)-lysidine synthase